MGCRLAQGYLFFRPTETAGVPALLAAGPLPLCDVGPEEDRPSRQPSAPVAPSKPMSVGDWAGRLQPNRNRSIVPTVSAGSGSDSPSATPQPAATSARRASAWSRNSTR